MPQSAQTQAVLLLTAHLARSSKGEPRPLSASEWSRLALWLKDHDLQPAALLSDDPARLLAGWIDKSVTTQRIGALLERGGALGIALEKWERAGLWAMTRSDPEYPARLKRRLRAASPPLLFGSGNPKLLEKGGVAVVGSRDARQPDLAFARELGDEASLQGMSIVSGGAKGIDEAAMLGALEAKGGTWTGAVENLKEQWVPLWVKPTQEQSSGNADLVRRGGRWLHDGKHHLSALASPAEPAASGMAEPERSLFDLPNAPEAQHQGMVSRVEAISAVEAVLNPDGQPPKSDELPEARSVYEFFLLKVKDLTATVPLAPTQLQDQLDLTKSQLDLWLKRAVSEGRVEKLGKPSRYRWQHSQLLQPSMFEEGDPQRRSGTGKARK
jgi:predicted Rossmann fold nucleotide-binding protein DprA/Smf involved in DNA uptake